MSLGLIADKLTQANNSTGALSQARWDLGVHWGGGGHLSLPVTDNLFSVG